MQYKVPQNVDIEDKVIAGLTLRQFMFLMGAGGCILITRYMLKAIGLQSLFMIIAILIASFGIALAFLKINDRPLEVFLLSAAKTFLRPSRRVWQKEVLTARQPSNVKPVQLEKKPRKKGVQEIKSNLQRLATIVDSGGVIDGDRITNIQPQRQVDEDGLNDVLQATEKPSNAIAELFDGAKKIAEKKKKEQPISTMASVKPDKNQFTYQKIQVADEAETTKMVEAAEDQGQEVEEMVNKDGFTF